MTLKERFDNLLWDKLAEHWGHNVSIAKYGDPEAPDNVCLECEDCSSVVLDAEIYTLCARENVDATDAYPELAVYDEEYHASLFRDGHEPDTGTYEVVFVVKGTRYYCYVNGCDTYLEALGLFFENHPHVAYSAVELCEEV